MMFCSTSLAENYIWHTSTVSRLHVFSDGSFAISVKKDNENCASPNGNDQYVVSVGESGMRESGRKNILATVLVALAQKAKISISFNPESASCYVNRLQLRYI